MLEVAGDYAPEDIIYRIVQMVTGFENKESDKSLQIHACEKCIALLNKSYTYECVVRLSALLFGEFGNLFIQKNKEYDLVKLADLLWNHTSVCKKTTLYSILDCMIKFVNFDENFREYAIPRFEQYLESWDTQLQQRAIEYIILSKRDNEDNEIPNMSEIRNNVVGKMPLYPASFYNNSILMKKLQKSSPKNYIDNKNMAKKNNDESNNEEAEDDYKNSELYKKDPNGFANEPNKNPNTVRKINRNNIPNFDMFKSMLTSTNAQGGVIYSDQNSIKVSLMIKKLNKGTLGYIFAFTPFASSNDKIENIDFSVSNFNSNDLLNISISKVKYDNVPQLMMKIQINEIFDEPPLINLSCSLGNRQINCQFNIPCLVTKFLSPYETTVENYSQLYIEYTNSTNDNYGRLDTIMYNPMNNNKNIMDFLKKLGLLMQNLNFKVFAPENKNKFHDIEGCSLFENGSTSIPILFQASFVPNLPSEFRFSLRSKHTNSHQYSNLLPAIFAVVKMWVNPN
jgi:AP-2 complex subunit alpha